ncbi:SRPBCC domain-containing protein [Nonomuraea ferruginea]|uniref:SRPBCC family protein n=1 Tax=Nonomuraea ferruginea TaxID=46174 RepID=UPI00361F7B0C
MTEERFTVEVTISAPVGEVWRALRDPEQIRRWHGWHFDGLDKEIDFIYAEHVTESPQEHWMEVQGGDRFELTDAGEGRTHLRMTRAPLSGDTEWDAYYDDVNEGWVTFIHQLKFALERHPGADRRTVFLSGHGTTPPLAAAGLDALAGLAPGTPYEHAAHRRAARGHGLVPLRPPARPHRGRLGRRSPRGRPHPAGPGPPRGRRHDDPDHVRADQRGVRGPGGALERLVDPGRPGRLNAARKLSAPAARLRGCRHPISLPSRLTGTHQPTPSTRSPTTVSAARTSARPGG